MDKMTKYWLAVAKSLHPDTSPEKLLTSDQIRAAHEEMFAERLAPNLEQQLISWKPRYADKKIPTRGGSRNRYLFRTEDGYTPSTSGRFRLYKLCDHMYDGTDKLAGPACPPKNKVEEEFHFLIDWYWASYQGGLGSIDDESEADLAESELRRSDIQDTEKVSLIASRRGQGVFRNNVARIESNCRLTGASELQFLIASHIKPWAHSTNHERLDGNNGLLLSPHVDRLFDKGYLTFQQDGSVEIAPEAKTVCSQWGIAISLQRPLSPEQERYMQYHRQHVYRRWLSSSVSLAD